MSSSTLCGPSNPLASLEKHTQRDRTLQQDRFNSQGLSLGGFRNQVPGDVQVEQEFVRFANGREFAQPGPSGIPLEFQQQQQPQFLPPPQQLQYHQQANEWAEDFGRLQIQNQSQQGLGFDGVTGPWREEFARTAEKTGSTQSWAGLEPMSRVSLFPYQVTGGQYAQPLRQQPGFIGQPVVQKVAEVFDEEAMERAFADAEREIELGVSVQSQNTQQTEMPPEETGEEIKEETVKDRSGQDDLARTAAQLLESLKENRSKKFQESKFLGLMRQLRDREVAVDGNQMVQLGS